VAVLIEANGAAVTVELSGWDRVMNWRRRVQFESGTIATVSVVDRSSLEQMIDHRALGWGTHNGLKRPGRRRIGSMLGRGVSGKQFWAVQPGPGSLPLVVLDLNDHEFQRAVLEVDDPESFRTKIMQP